MAGFKIKHLGEKQRADYLIGIIQHEESTRDVVIAVATRGPYEGEYSLEVDLALTANNEAIKKLSKLIGKLKDSLINGEELIWRDAGLTVGEGLMLSEMDLAIDPGFTAVFSEELTPEQVTGIIEALGDYYRAIGGLGFDVSFEYQAVASGELIHA